MSLYLESYTIPGDLPQEDIVFAMRRVNRRTNVQMLRCAYDLSAGKVWCVSEAPSEADVRRGFESVEFPFTLDEVKPAASADVLNNLADADRIFDPSQTRPADVGTAGRS